jgi:hypothetical protein
MGGRNTAKRKNMTTLLSILVALIIVGVVLWGISAILRVVPISEPFRTIIWVIVVIIAVLSILQMSGLYRVPLL